MKLLKGASAGASGAKLLQGKQRGYPVVIKVFPVDCPVKYIKGIRRRNNGIRDYGNFEIGTGLMLTDTFIITHITQNIVTCYNYTICDYGYNTEWSICHKQQIPRQENYPIINEITHPLYSFHEPYFSPMINGVVETPQRDDMIRFMMVEKCEGDIQGFIETNYDNFNLLTDTLNNVTIMIFHTLLLFDSVLGGYSHNDLGTRNILYVEDPYKSYDTYWRYVFPDMTSVDIPTTTIIPKIWDYAYVRYGTAKENLSYYDYIGDSSSPNLDFIHEEGRENDVYIFLQDIDLHLRKFGITSTIFNRLDLNRIKSCSNNTDAIQEYFIQNPISENLLSNDQHDIIHIFSS